MIQHNKISDDDLIQNIKSYHLQFGGNARLKIYGTLDCKSGKRMKRDNRVFFKSASEAINDGYRPCGNCMREDYKEWISLNR